MNNTQLESARLALENADRCVDQLESEIHYLKSEIPKSLAVQRPSGDTTSLGLIKQLVLAEQSKKAVADYAATNRATYNAVAHDNFRPGV
jgi:hypothetical protein